MAAQPSSTRYYTPAELLPLVRAHALEHYEEDGWDYLVECYSDDEILEVLETGAVRSLKTALFAVQEAFALRLIDEQRKEVRNLSGEW